MKFEKFFTEVFGSIKEIFRKPLLILFSLILWVLFVGLSKLGSRIAPLMQTTWANVIWVIVAALISISFVSYFFAGMIALTKKHKFREFFENGNKFFIRNFLILTTVFITSIMIGRISHYTSLFIGHALSLNVNAAKILYVLIYFAGLVGILIFLTYSSVLLVLENLSFAGSIRRSYHFVKKEYLLTLSTLILFFLIFSVLNYVSGKIGDLITYGFFTPFLVCLLARIVRK